MTSITFARLCKPPILLAVFCAVYFDVASLLLAGCAAHKKVAAVPIPTCGASLVIPKGCTGRQWGNAVEVDCPKDPKIYICNKLEHPSPTK
jgi:hypothetical protein